MRSDFYKGITRKRITLVPDGAGSFTESTASDTIKGMIVVLNGNERMSNQMLGTSVIARLHSDDDVLIKDRIVDLDGTTYEVRFCNYNFGFPVYDLEKV